MIRALFNPNRFAGTVVFGVLALLPSIVHLNWLSLSASSPLLALGPLAAGFGLAARFSHTRLGFASLGTIVTALIWTANCLMMAGHGCCATY